MSKKKKNKYYKSLGLTGKKGKDNKKSLKKAKRDFKTVRPTLDKKEGKANKKLVTKMVKVPDKLLKSRAKCNHADGTMTVKEYLEMSPNGAAYTPMLNMLVNTFGEENIAICKRCFEAIVTRDQVSTESVEEALAVLYAACGIVTANVRMKRDEVKSVNKLKGLVEDFAPVMEFMKELEANGSHNASAVDDDPGNAGIEIEV